MRSEEMIGLITKWKPDTERPDDALDRDGWIKYKKT